MRITILLTYRPTKHLGNHSTNNTKYTQDENGIWYDVDGNIWSGRNELETAIQAIRKNSVYNHKIILTVDKDVFPNTQWLSKFGDISIFRSSFELPPHLDSTCRSTSTIKEALLSLPDDEFITNFYISDTVCAKYWDKYIDDAHKIYGDDWVYAPMFVEPRSPYSCGIIPHCGNDIAKEFSDKFGVITTDKIWNDWRKLCCHSLTIPPYTKNTYIDEKYFDDWIAIANKYDRLHIEEHYGYRNYGYWISLCGRNSIFKKAVETLDIGHGFDIYLDNKIANKLIVTHSFLLHAHNEVKLDDIEVEKIA